MSGCTTKEQMKTNDQVKQLSVDMVQSQKMSGDLTSKVQDLEERLAEIHGQFEEQGYHIKRGQQSTKDKLANFVKQLQDQLDLLTDRVEELQNTVEEQSKFIGQVTKSLQKMSGKGQSSGKKSVYQRGIDAFIAGNFSESIPLLASSLDNKKLASSKQSRAMYCLGRMYFARKKYDKAMVYFSKVFTNFPQSNYATGSLFFLGQSFEKKGNTADAKASYQELISKYPKSKYASKARDQLAN